MHDMMFSESKHGNRFYTESTVFCFTEKCLWLSLFYSYDLNPSCRTQPDQKIGL